MTKVIPVRVSFDAIIDKVMRDEACMYLPRHVIRTLVVVAATAAIYFLNEDNKLVQAIAAQMQWLAEKTLDDAGVTDKRAVFDVVDSVFADAYESAVKDIPDLVSSLSPVKES